MSKSKKYSLPYWVKQTLRGTSVPERLIADAVRVFSQHGGDHPEIHFEGTPLELANALYLEWAKRTAPWSGFYPTPLPIASQAAERLNIKAGDIVLDAGAGFGNLSQAVIMRGGQPIMVEYGYSVHEIARAVWEGTPHVVTQEDFLDGFRPSQYDCIIGNPPFGKVFGASDAALSFMQRYADLSRAGTRVSVILPQHYLDADKPKARVAMRERFDLLTATDLPPDAFAPLTKISTTLYVLRVNEDGPLACEVKPRAAWVRVTDSVEAATEKADEPIVVQSPAPDGESPAIGAHKIETQADQTTIYRYGTRDGGLSWAPIVFFADRGQAVQWLKDHSIDLASVAGLSPAERGEVFSVPGADVTWPMLPDGRPRAGLPEGLRERLKAQPIHELRPRHVDLDHDSATIYACDLLTIDEVSNRIEPEHRWNVSISDGSDVWQVLNLWEEAQQHESVGGATLFEALDVLRQHLAAWAVEAQIDVRPLNSKWTVAAIGELRDLISRSTRPILLADPDLGVPTIHGLRNPQHLGCGEFCAETTEYKITWQAGGAMERLSNDLGYTLVKVERGTFPYDKASVLALLDRWLVELTPTDEDDTSTVADREAALDARIMASKASGIVHLDQTVLDVDIMRGLLVKSLRTDRVCYVETIDKANGRVWLYPDYDRATGERLPRSWYQSGRDLTEWMVVGRVNQDLLDHHLAPEYAVLVPNFSLPVGVEIQIFSPTVLAYEQFAAQPQEEREPWTMTKAEMLDLVLSGRYFFTPLGCDVAGNQQRLRVNAYTVYARQHNADVALKTVIALVNQHHGGEVYTAVLEGKSVPDTVLADYPDLVEARKKAQPANSIWDEPDEFEITVDGEDVRVKFEGRNSIGFDSGSFSFEFRGPNISTTGYHSHYARPAETKQHPNPTAAACAIGESLAKDYSAQLAKNKKKWPVKYQGDVGVVVDGQLQRATPMCWNACNQCWDVWLWDVEEHATVRPEQIFGEWEYLAWRMTLDEYTQMHAALPNVSECYVAEIQQAIQEGKPVPPRIIAPIRSLLSLPENVSPFDRARPEFEAWVQSTDPAHAARWSNAYDYFARHLALNEDDWEYLAQTPEFVAKRKQIAPAVEGNPFKATQEQFVLWVMANVDGTAPQAMWAEAYAWLHQKSSRLYEETGKFFENNPYFLAACQQLEAITMNFRFPTHDTAARWNHDQGSKLTSPQVTFDHPSEAKDGVTVITARVNPANPPEPPRFWYLDVEDTPLYRDSISGEELTGYRGPYTDDDITGLLGLPKAALRLIKQGEKVDGKYLTDQPDRIKTLYGAPVAPPVIKRPKHLPDDVPMVIEIDLGGRVPVWTPVTIVKVVGQQLVCQRNDNQGSLKTPLYGRDIAWRVPANN